MSAAATKVLGAPGTSTDSPVDSSTAKKPTEQSTFSKIICTVAWLALSAISFYFTAMLAIGTVAFSSPWILGVCAAAAITVGCFALYKAIMCATAPSAPSSHSPGISPSSSTESLDEDADLHSALSASMEEHDTGSPGSADSPGKLGTSTSGTKSTSKSGATTSNGPAAGSSMVVQWKYDDKGKTTSLRDVKGYTQAIRLASTPPARMGLGDPTFYQITKELNDVPGDGNCGFYSLSAILIKNAIDSPDFRAKVKKSIEESFRFGNDVEMWEKAHYKDKKHTKKTYTHAELLELKAQVLKILEETEKPNKSMQSILTHAHGAIFNRYLRTLLIADFEALHDDDKFPLTIENEIEIKKGEYYTRTLLQDTGVNFVSVEPPVILAITKLLDMDVKTIEVMPHFTDKKKTILNVSNALDDAQTLPQDPPLGYLVFIVGGNPEEGQKGCGGHFLAAFPRNQVKAN